MFSKIVLFSIRNKVYVLMATIILLIVGVYNLFILPIDAVPDITNNQVVVITTSPSLAATDIERFITIPIEQSLSAIPGRIELRSFSRFGLSIVTIVFNDETDVYWARQQISEQLSHLQSVIPASIGIPKLGPVTTGLGEIFQYTVVPKKGYEGRYSLQELREIQDWIIRKNILGTIGVADVSSFGGKVRQFQISIEQDKLNAYGITIQNVFDAVNLNNENAGGAYIERGPNAYGIRTEGLIQNKEELGSILIKQTVQGIPIFLREIASIEKGSAIRYGALVHSDYGEVAGGIVMMIKNGNSNQIIDNVKERIKQIEKTLPEGVAIEPFLDRTKMVNASIKTVCTNLIEGALIVVFVLVLFLGNIRAGLIVASVIPLSMLFAVIAMNVFGVSGNLMSLGAIDFGLIVDGAVIIVEAVLHQLKKQNSQSNSFAYSIDHVVGSSSIRMMNSAVFGQAIILIVYLPILTLVGIEGKMFKPMAQTVCFALVGAFILSVTYVPVISALVLKIPTTTRKNFSDSMMVFFERIYLFTIFKAFRWKVTIVVATVLLFGFSLYVFSTMGGEFIPTLEEGDFAVEFRILTGGSLEETISATTKSMKVLKDNFPEVEKVVSKIGSGEIPTDPMPIEAADMMIILKKKSEWTSANTFDELAEKMSHSLEVIPGISYGFQYPVQMRFNELMTGAKQDVVVKIYGDNLDSLENYANKIGEKIKTIQGATEIYIEQVVGLPQLEIHYNRDALARYGISVTSANTVVQTLMAGSSAGAIYEGERRFDIVLRMKDAKAKGIDDIKNMYIPTSQGTNIPLSYIADVQIVYGPNQIQREDTKRRIIVGFNVRGNDIATVVDRLQTVIPKTVTLPSGYFITYGGQFENLEQAKGRLLIAVPVALLLIFTILYFAFKSVWNGMLIFTAIPLSAIGGVFALWLRSMPFSISAGIGFIALFGVAVLNGIVLVSEIERRYSTGGSLVRSIIGGTVLRLRPVLMTASVASLGFLPMAFSTGSGAEVQRPLATVVIGGLISSTLLTLLFIPLLYLFMQSMKRKASTVVSNSLKVFLVFCVFSTPLFAQTIDNNEVTYISEQELLQKAIETNLSRKQQFLEIESSKLLEGTSAEIPKTIIASDLGQYNSSFFDTKFSVEQSFSFPTVYSKKRDYLKSNTDFVIVELRLKELHLQKDIQQYYNELQFHIAQKELFNQIDSIVDLMFQKEEVRLQLGSNDRTAYFQLKLLQSQNKFNRTKNQNALQHSQMEVALLLNDGVLYSPNEPFVKRSISLDTSSNLHPLLELSNVNLFRQKKNKEVKNQLLLPNIYLSFANQSLIGWMTTNGNDEIYSNASTRYNSFQIGLGFSIFRQAEKASIESASIGEKIAFLEVQRTKNQLTSQQQRISNQLKADAKLLKHYEENILPESNKILSMFQLQYSEGSISYLEWTNNIVSVLTTRLQYLETLKDYNTTVIDAKFYQYSTEKNDK